MYRRTSQHLLPLHCEHPQEGQYDIYPCFHADDASVEEGFVSLAEHLSSARRVVIDGYVGVLWETFREHLEHALQEVGVVADWHSVDDALLDEDSIHRIIDPYLGGDDPLWGTRFTGELTDLFDTHKLRSLQPNDYHRMSILYGTGAALVQWDDAVLIYLDVPKNEIQFRSRVGSITNIGSHVAESPKEMYKRFYFVDWVILNKHKHDILNRIDVFVDEQRVDVITWIRGNELRETLCAMSTNAFRARPWFEPGPWGGDWMKTRFSQLPHDVPNYAWSFELISPENGLLIEHNNRMLECSFDMLMFAHYPEILGHCAPRFRTEFPIRFDYLDTFNGGNLSVQCHPRPEYIIRNFGENFTQDETYYITDCTEDARVYLGFREGIDREEFRMALEQSAQTGKEVDIDRFVNSEPAHKHDLFLIPNGTIHCSGTNNLVLEISATPYIFTFKMYDWIRRDLEGNMRPLNIARAFENLYFERQGHHVQNELISVPSVIESGHDWQIIHLPTHPDHFYDVHRIEFESTITLITDNDCHVLNLVEGTAMSVETNGRTMLINYAETFIIPAAAGSYRLINRGTGTAKVVKAFVKRGS